MEEDKQASEFVDSRIVKTVRSLRESSAKSKPISSKHIITTSKPPTGSANNKRGKHNITTKNLSRVLTEKNGAIRIPNISKY